MGSVPRWYTFRSHYWYIIPCPSTLGGHQDFLIGDLRRRGPFGNKAQLQVIDDPVPHGIVGEESDDLHLHLIGLLAIPVADLAFPFIQGEHRLDPILAHPLGLSLCLGPDPAAKGEPSARHSPASLSTSECAGNGSPDKAWGPCRRGR